MTLIGEMESDRQCGWYLPDITPSRRFLSHSAPGS